MRTVIDQLPGSKIREVANAGFGRPDLLAFWFGESDEVTPEFIRQAAIDSLHRGETLYAHNLGLPALREALAAEGPTLIHLKLDTDVSTSRSTLGAIRRAAQAAGKGG